MTIKTILITITLGLLIWLLIDNTSQLDLAATKNDGLISWQKMKVDSFQNIDSVKIYAKSKLDIIRQTAEKDDMIATKRIWIIIALIIVQLFLFINTLKRKIV